MSKQLVHTVSLSMSILFILLFIPLLNFAQNPANQLKEMADKTDPSTREKAYVDLLNAQKKDGAKLQVLKPLCKFCIENDQTQSFVLYSSQGIKLARSLGDDSTLAYLYKLNGMYQSFNGNNEKAIHYFLQAASIAKKGGFRLLEASNYNNAGGLLIDESRTTEAEKYLKLSLSNTLGRLISHALRSGIIH